MSWILTYSGQTLDLLNPSVMAINAMDIAHSSEPKASIPERPTSF